MKSQKTNAFQLAIAGGVLVLVLVCATFAWFAVGDHAWVRDIVASVASPDVPSQLNSIEYYDGADWVIYNGGHLDIVPGQTYTFRIKFTAKETDTISMSITDISASLREAASSSEGEGDETEETTKYNVVTEPLMLSDMLLYTLNNDDDEFKPFPDDGYLIKNETVDGNCQDGDSMQYIYVYQIKMDPDAGNDYMGKKLSFAMAIDLPKSEANDENGGTEG